jgi:hypothetical protein
MYIYCIYFTHTHTHTLYRDIYREREREKATTHLSESIHILCIYYIYYTHTIHTDTDIHTYIRIYITCIYV